MKSKSSVGARNLVQYASDLHRQQAAKERLVEERRRQREKEAQERAMRQAGGGRALQRGVRQAARGHPYRRPDLGISADRVVANGGAGKPVGSGSGGEGRTAPGSNDEGGAPDIELGSSDDEGELVLVDEAAESGARSAGQREEVGRTMVPQSIDARLRRTRRSPLAARCSPPTTCHPQPATVHPSTTNHQPPPTTTHHSPTTTHPNPHSPPSTHHPPLSNHPPPQPPLSTLHPPPTTHHPSPTTRHPPLTTRSSPLSP